MNSPNAPEKLEPLWSNNFPDRKSIPLARVLIDGIYRNGVLIEEDSIVYFSHFQGGSAVYKHKKCEGCNGNMGWIYRQNGKVFYRCFGLSCLFKN